MDRSQLVIIVVTAVSTAIAKELFQWLFSLLKTLSIASTIKEKLSKTFTKRNLSTAWNVALLAMLVWFFIVLSDAPSTHVHKFETVIIYVVGFIQLFRVIDLLGGR